MAMTQYIQANVFNNYDLLKSYEPEIKGLDVDKAL
jgi:hypothetical protein